MLVLFSLPKSLLTENLLCLSVELLLGVLQLLLSPCSVCVANLAFRALSYNLHEIVLVSRSNLVRPTSLNLELLSVLCCISVSLLYDGEKKVIYPLFIYVYVVVIIYFNTFNTLFFCHLCPNVCADILGVDVNAGRAVLVNFVAIFVYFDFVERFACLLLSQQSVDCSLTWFLLQEVGAINFKKLKGK